MPKSLTIIPPDPKLHRQELFELIARTFSHGGYFEFRNRLRNGYLDNSHYDWAASRIGLLEDRLVSHFGVWDYQMRIGTARVRCGGIGVVATHFDYRKRGLMEQTAPASVAAMRDLGYDMSILFGISDFYHRFGYTRAFPDVDYHVQLKHLPQDKPARRLQSFVPESSPQFDKLFNKENATLTGTAVRPTYAQFINEGGRTGVLWRSPAGRLEGWIIYYDKGERLQIVDAAGQPDAILRAAAAVARKLGADRVQFRELPYRSDLARALRRGTCQVETRHVRCGGAMVRVINLGTCLVKMAPELSRRLRESHLADWRGELSIANKEESVVLRIARGTVQTAPGRSAANSIKGGDEIAQLLVGADDPMELIDAYPVRLKGDARLLLPILFPNEHPALHVLDRF